MRNILALFFLVFIGFSCSSNEDSKSYQSLLDIGFVEEETADLGKEAKSMNIFGSNSGKHYGIDISNWQGNIMKVYNRKDSLRFIICKATEGVTVIDPDFRNNWNEIKEKGLIRGAYHFYLCSDDPVDQANHFTNTAFDINSSDIAPILDIEQGSMVPSVSGDQMEKDILVYLKAVESKLNRKPMIYTDYEFAQKYLKNPIFANYDLWLAEWSNAASPLLPDIWKQKGLKIWQKSASYDAYSKTIDLDEYTGALADIVD